MFTLGIYALSFSRIATVAERLWPSINEPVANRSFQNFDELEEVLFQRCQVLLKQSSLDISPKEMVGRLLLNYNGILPKKS
jgi:hypothetical protein